MLLIFRKCLLVPMLLIEQKVFPPPVHNVLDWVAVNNHHALLWGHHSVFWRRFYSHHTPKFFSVSSIPPAKRKSEGGPPCNSMPLGARSGVLCLRA